MALYKRSETVRDFNGVVVSKVSVKVVTGDPYSETSPLASLFQDAAGLIPLANPLTADAAGQYSYWAAGGTYSEKISRPGYYSVTNDGFLVGGEKGDTGPMGNPGTPGPPGFDVRPLLSDGTDPANGSGMVAHNESLMYPAGSIGKALQNRLFTTDLAETMDPTTGANMVGFNAALAYAAGTVGKFLKDLGSSIGATLIGYIAPFTGAVQRTQAAKNDEHISLADFPDLATALSGIGATKTILHVNVSASVAVDTTIPATLQMDMEPGAIITVAVGKTLTINGPFRAKPVTIFAGAGAVTFGPGAVDGVYPHWWGTPATDASPLVGSAGAALANIGGDILFPPGDYNFFHGSVVLPVGVNFEGLGGKLYRKFPYVSTDGTTSSVFRLNGNNTIRGIIWDGGGWDAAVYPGVGNGGTPYIYYQDFATISGVGNFRFIKNTFKNGGGSFITPYGPSVYIEGNQFQDWKDHCIYLAESGATTSNGFQVIGNDFSVAQAVNPTNREPVKFKGRVNNVLVSNNTFNLPNAVDAFCHFGLAYTADMVFGNITISNNSGYVNGVFVFIEQYDDGAGSLDTTYITSALIAGNTVKAPYFLRAGGLPSSAVIQNGIRITSLIIKNNLSTGSSLVQINGRDGVGHNGIELCEISGNTFDINADFWRLIGNIKTLIISKNTFTSTVSNYWFAITFGDASLATKPWKAGQVNAAFRGTAAICDNILTGNMRGLVTEIGTDATHPSVIGLDLYVSGNKILNSAVGGLDSFVATSAAYPPTTKLHVGPGNYIAPSIGAYNASPFQWPAALITHSGVASPSGYRTHAGAPTETPYFIGEELLDTTNSKWYKAKGLTSVDWVALN